MSRPNLKVVTGAVGDKVQFENGRATGAAGDRRRPAR